MSTAQQTITREATNSSALFEPALPAAFFTEAFARRLRGRKCEPFDGGTRTVALVSGGFVPAHLRGGTFDGLMHVADW